MWIEPHAETIRPEAFSLFYFWAISGAVQGLLLVLSLGIAPRGLGGLYAVLRINPRLITCKA